MAATQLPPAPAQWRSLPPAQLLAQLDHYLHSRIPGARLTRQALPLAPEISLHLINEDYPRDGLAPAQAEALMDNPPYWGFCWGSGQALARWLLDNPRQVAGRTLVDLGCGSGVVGIAAALAGAGRVILCDQDEQALAASRLNAELNGARVSYWQDLDVAIAQLRDDNAPADALVVVADVFYDRDNLPLLPYLQDQFGAVLVADSRLKGQPLPGLEIFFTCQSHTVPDLDESAEFNRITLYRTPGGST